MAKFAALLIAALAFHAALAAPSQLHSQYVQKLKSKIQKVTDEAVGVIDSANVEDPQVRRWIAHQASEYAYAVSGVHAHIQHIIQHNQGGAGQQVLQEVVHKLAEIVYGIQQVVNAEPSQLKLQLKNNIRQVIPEVEHLVQVAQQHYEHAPEGHDVVSDQIEDAVDELVSAVHQIHIRGQIHGHSHQQIKDAIESAVQQVQNSIQNAQVPDGITVSEVAHVVHEYAHDIGHIIHLLLREIHHHQGDASNVIEQILHKLVEIRNSVQHVVDPHGQTDVHAYVNQIRGVLKEAVHDVGVQIQRLVQVAQSVDQNSNEGHDLNNLVRNVVADAASAARQLQRQVEAVDQD